MSMQHNWSLRLARPEDASQMPAIERAAAISLKDDLGLEDLDPDYARGMEQLTRLIRKGHCLVSHVGGKMAGFLVSEPFSRELHIWEMDVHPDFQRRGIGAGLMRAAQIDAHNSGFRALTLTAFRDIGWSAQFYRQLGFDEMPSLDAHPRLARLLEQEAKDGLPSVRRCAMICFLS